MAKPAPLSITVDRIIDASPDELYDIISDVTRIGEFSTECVDAEWLDGATGPDVGVRFKGSNRLGKASWSTKPTITQADRGEVFEFDVPGASGPVWRYEFTALDDGRTHVVQSMAQQKPLNAFIRFLQRRNGVTDRRSHLAEGMTTTLDNLAAAFAPAAA